MKKIMSLVLICLFTFALFSCEVDESKKTYRWGSEKDYTQVTEIKVVIPTDIENFDINTCKVIKEIDLSFAYDLMDLVDYMEMRRQEDITNEPYQLCLFFMFDNGEYDVISKVAPSRYKYDENGIIQRYSTDLVVDSGNFFGIISYCLCFDQSEN